MKEFKRNFQVDASIEEVAAFHNSVTALKKLNPFPIWVQLHHFDPMGDGAVAEFTLWLGVFPIRWRALHSEVDELTGFTDTQVLGPFSSWVHVHKFTKLNDESTLVEDHIRADFGEGLKNGIISRLMWLGLPTLFFYRGWVTKKNLNRKNL